MSHRSPIWQATACCARRRYLDKAVDIDNPQGMHKFVTKGLFLGCFAASATLSCTTVSKTTRQQATQEVPVKTEVVPPVPGPQQPQNTDKNPWQHFPSANATLPPLQDIYEHSVSVLSAEVTATAICAKSKVDFGIQRSRLVQEQRQAIADALGWLGPVVSDTWTRAAKDARELELLGQQVRQTQSKAVFGFEVEAPDALSWLAALSAPKDYCDAKDDAARMASASKWALTLLMWSTSEYKVYTTAFAAFGQPWTHIPEMTGDRNPWLSQAAAASSVARALGGTGRVYRVRAATSDEDPMRFSIAYGPSDENTDGTLPTLMHASTMLGGVHASLRAKDTQRWLISESLVPLRIPACMIVTGGELVLPEVPAGKTAHFDLNSLGVSDRCGELETLQFQVLRSASPTKTTLTLWFEPVDGRATVDSFTLDTDVAGHSAPQSQDFEVSLSGTLTGATVEPEVTVTSLSSAWTFVGPATLPLAVDGQGTFSTLDDLDVRLQKSPAPATSTENPLDALNADDSVAWLRTQISGQHPLIEQLQVTARQCVKSLGDKQAACEDACTSAQVQCLEPLSKDPLLLTTHAAGVCRATATTCREACTLPSGTAAQCRPVSDLSSRLTFSRYLPIRR
jgi:hypothetical protein